MIHKDVLIVGGGPAGAACAHRLKQHGIDCLIVDQAEFPRLKLCAGWITPQVLQDLEVLPEEAPFGLTHFSTFNLSIKGVKLRMSVNQYAVRRIDFDAWLLARASAEVIQHTVVDIRLENERYIVDDAYSARVLVGAGGTHCPVYRTFFEAQMPRNEKLQIVALEEEFPYPVQDDHCHLWFLEHGLPGYSWYVPKQGGFVNVGIGGMTARLMERGDSLKRHWTLLVDALAKQGLVKGYELRPRGYSYFLRHKNALTRIGSAYLAGDALGLATRDMGEGIGPAIRSGLLAADAILADQAYSIGSIPRYSIPSLLRFRGSSLW